MGIANLWLITFKNCRRKLKLRWFVLGMKVLSSSIVAFLAVQYVLGKMLWWRCVPIKPGLGSTWYEWMREEAASANSTAAWSSFWGCVWCWWQCRCSAGLERALCTAMEEWNMPRVPADLFDVHAYMLTKKTLSNGQDSCLSLYRRYPKDVAWRSETCQNQQLTVRVDDS